MPHLLISSCSVDKPGVLTLRGAPNERQPWTPTPRIAIDVHTICWYMIGTPYDREPVGRARGYCYILPFTVGTSFGIIHFGVVVSVDARGEYVPRNTDLISELIHQFSGVL
ncbi:MAG: hypothetical protein KA274_18625 [Ilumatobacteraceae bacterium]|nr:hypothetical protein [Ilumatobacteraceae bacterium]